MTDDRRARLLRRARLGLLLVGLYLVLDLVLHAFLFHPSRGEAPPAAIAETVRYPASDGTVLEGYWVPAEGSSHRAVVVFHGNADTAADGVPWARALAARGSDVLLAEYRGYGASEGSPSASGIESDAEGAIRYVLEERGVARSRLVVQGHSLGGAAAIAALAGPANDCAGGILLSTFTSLHDMARAVLGLPLTYLVRDGYALDSAARAPTIRAPILHFHGDADEVVPFALGARLDALLPRSRFVPVPGGSHDVWNDRITAEVLAFLDEVTP